MMLEKEKIAKTNRSIDPVIFEEEDDVINDAFNVIQPSLEYEPPIIEEVIVKQTISPKEKITVKNDDDKEQIFVINDSDKELNFQLAKDCAICGETFIIDIGDTREICEECEKKINQEK